MINVPVYSDENGTPHISIFVEDGDGTFRRTQNEPLRLLRDDIKGISISQGDLVSSLYDRQARRWHTPTVTFHYGRPQSFYQFLRDKVAHNRFFVFTKPQLAGHISKFSLHELQLKNSTSQRKIAILKEKYIEALQLWQEAQIEANARSKTGDSEAAKVVKSKVVENKAVPGEPVDALPQATRENDISQPPISSDHRQRKNLVREFSLTKQSKSPSPNQKEHNQHFYKRFIFTID